VQSFIGHNRFVYPVAFSPDGNYVLTGSGDSTAKLWTLQGEVMQSYTGHNSAVFSVTFSPDGNYVLTGSGDGTAKLWTLNGEEIQSFIGHSSAVFSVAFSPDKAFVKLGGRQLPWNYVLTGSQDGTAKLWTANGT
jgi:WD40 repeat protein